MRIVAALGGNARHPLTVGTVTTGPCAWFSTAWMTVPGPW